MVIPPVALSRSGIIATISGGSVVMHLLGSFIFAMLAMLAMLAELASKFC